MSLSNKVGNATKPTTATTQNITVATGFGKPRIIFVFMTNQTAEGYAAGTSGTIGIIVRRNDDSIQKGYIAWASDDAVSPSNCGKGTNLTAALKCFSDGTPTIADVCDVSAVASWPTDGFQLNWTTSSASAKIFHWSAWNGDAIENVFLGSFTGPTAGGTGNRTYTGVGFEGTGMFMLSGTIASLTDNAGLVVAMGAAADASQQASCCVSELDANTMNTTKKSYVSEAACWVNLNQSSPPSLDQKAVFVEFNSDGFVWNHTTVGVGSAIFLALIVKGPVVDVDGFLSNAATGTQAFATRGIPAGALFFGSPTDTTTLDAVVNEVGMSFSATDGTGEEAIATQGDNLATTDENSRTITTKVCPAIRPSQTTDCEADITSLNNDGVTINWSTAVARRFALFAMSDPTFPEWNSPPSVMPNPPLDREILIGV